MESGFVPAAKGKKMSDLISREWCLIEYDKRHKGLPGNARKIMEEAPTVDAVPVVHGYWEQSNDNTFLSPCYQCSICGRKINTFGDPIKKAPYCHCGAKMDGEMKEHERN